MREEFEKWHRQKFQTKYTTGQPTRDMHNGIYDEKYGPAIVRELVQPAHFRAYALAFAFQRIRRIERAQYHTGA